MSGKQQHVGVVHVTSGCIEGEEDHCRVHLNRNLPEGTKLYADQGEQLALAIAALKRITASMTGATSAYRTYARRHKTMGTAEIDSFFTTRVADMDRAVERANAAIEQLTG